MSKSSTSATPVEVPAQVTLRFTTADADLPILHHELELVLCAMQPLLAWLHRRGGRLTIDTPITSATLEQWATTTSTTGA